MSFRIGKEPRNNRVTKVNSILEGIVKAFGLEKQFTIETLRQSWPEIAGHLAGSSRPEKIEHGMIYILVKHPAIANEIVMLKNTIMSRCEEVFGEKIKDVRTIMAAGQRRRTA